VSSESVRLVQKQEGCRLWGKINIAKVQGNIQLAPGTAYEHNNRLLHDMTPLRNQKLDISHTLDELSFGEKYPGQINPLKGQTFDQRRITKQNARQRPGASPFSVVDIYMKAMFDICNSLQRKLLHMSARAYVLRLGRQCSKFVGKWQSCWPGGSAGFCFLTMHNLGCIAPQFCRRFPGRSCDASEYLFSTSPSLLSLLPP
jgi:hypothetical protein